MLGKEASVVLVASLLVLVPLAISPASGASSEAALLVSYKEGARADEIAARAGASLVRDEPGLGVALVRAGSGAAAALARDGAVLAVEADRTVRVAGASWNGAQWNGAQWNGAQWNGASWNGAQWNGAQWNGASWNGAQWNGAQWNLAWDGTQWNGGSDDAPAPPWGLLAVRAFDAWSHGIPQENRLVCLVDTGIDAAHPALAARVHATYNALAPGSPATDDAGHGTHLAGIVAAVHDGAWPVPGLSAARLAAAKALGADGAGATSDVIEGMAWCGKQGAHVVLLAFTEDQPTKAFRRAVAALQRDGALVVASAGNAGCGKCVSEPAAFPGVLGVGAFGPDGATAPFSSDGPEVDLLAPGVLVTSAFPGEGMRTGSGTSQAAAFAAGAAALLWSHHPQWHAPRVAAHLEATADPEGRLDLAQAVAKASGVA